MSDLGFGFNHDLNAARTPRLMKDRACRNCEWWRSGDCIRHAPTLEMRNGMAHSVFPYTNPTDRCGDWQDREERVE